MYELILEECKFLSSIFNEAILDGQKSNVTFQKSTSGKTKKLKWKIQKALQEKAKSWSGKFKEYFYFFKVAEKVSKSTKI